VTKWKKGPGTSRHRTLLPAIDPSRCSGGTTVGWYDTITPLPHSQSTSHVNLLSAGSARHVAPSEKR